MEDSQTVKNEERKKRDIPTKKREAHIITEENPFNFSSED